MYSKLLLKKLQVFVFGEWSPLLQHSFVGLIDSIIKSAQMIPATSESKGINVS